MEQKTHYKTVVGATEASCKKLLHRVSHVGIAPVGLPCEANGTVSNVRTSQDPGYENHGFIKCTLGPRKRLKQLLWLKNLDALVLRCPQYN